MKIILSDPPKKEGNYDLSYPNLGILYLISSLRNRFNGDLEIMYLQGHHDLAEHISIVQRFNPDIYGISFATLTSKLAYKTINTLHEHNPSLPIICGGPHPTADPEDVLENSQANICVLGEGENVICDLVEHFINQKLKLEEIEGIAYKNGNRIIKTKKRSVIDNLDSIPFPAWDTINFRDYLGMHLRKADPQSYIVVSRGCPFDCNFCSNPVWKYNKPWVRTRSANNIAEEIKLLYKLGVREIYLNADEFNVSIKWAIEVCNEIKKLGYKDLYFQCNVRADKITEDLVRAFKEINLWLIHIGIESGNQKTLDGIGKHITIEQINNACRMIKKAGLKIFGYVMLYHAWEKDGKLYWETPEDVNNTLNYCKWLFKEKLIDYMSWQPATPFPGSHLWQTAIRFDLFPEYEITDYRRANMKLPGISYKDFARSMRKGYRIKLLNMLKSGHIQWRHINRIKENVKVLLGYGSKTL